MKKLTDFERGYVVGFLANGGSLFLCPVRNGGTTKHLQLTSRNEDGVKRLQTITGIGRFYKGKSGYSLGRRSPTFAWRVEKTTDLLKILPLIISEVPRLRRRAQLIQEFCISRFNGKMNLPYSSRELEIIEELSRG